MTENLQCKTNYIPSGKWVKNEVTVMQLNCILGIKTQEEYQSWENRKDLVLKQIKDINPDIMALENVDQYEEGLKPELSKMGYEGYNFLPDGQKTSIVMIWKTEYNQLVSINQKNFTPKAHGSGGFLLAVFRNISLGIDFICTACQLKSGEQFNSVRGEQTVEILKAIKELIERDKIIYRLIMLGNFNDYPHSLFYQLLTRGLYTKIVDNLMQGWEISPLKSNLTIQSAYPHEKNDDKQRLITYKRKNTSVLNFIFFSEGFKTESLYSSLSEENNLFDSELPCEEDLISYHLPIAAKFSFV